MFDFWSSHVRALKLTSQGFKLIHEADMFELWSSPAGKAESFLLNLNFLPASSYNHRHTFYSLSSSRPRSMRSSPSQPIFVSSSVRHVTTWRIFLNLVHNRCTIAHICRCVWILQSGWSSIASAVSKTIANIKLKFPGVWARGEDGKNMRTMGRRWRAVWYQTSILPLFTPDL